jgi:hypothetical protein
MRNVNVAPESSAMMIWAIPTNIGIKPPNSHGPGWIVAEPNGPSAL